MQTILLERPGHLCLLDREMPGEPGPGEALVRIHQVGVCGTDLHAYQGNQPFFQYPRILGHELGVEVLAVASPEQGVAVGARCAVEPYLACDHCPACLRGKPNCCLHLQVLGVHIDGGMREFAHVPIRSLHSSSSLSYEQLALVEPLAIGAHAVARAQLHPEERVLVVGAGPIGLAVTQFALLAGVQVMVLDVSEQRLHFCQERWPQVVCLDGRGDPLATLQRRCGDDLPTAVFDATGNLGAMHASFAYAGHGGRLIFVGLAQGDITFHDPEFHRRELTLLSSRNATSVDFQHVIAVLESGQIDLAPWITHRATAETMLEQFPRWFERESGIIKALIAFPSFA
jgi:2-desacetyl-2-hydroxyethyl bacteriochlorophyllide A dehydrogenase